MDDGSQRFGDLLRRSRLDAGLTQEELANRTGLSVRAIGDMERGITSRPHVDSVSMLAQALGLDERGSAELARASRPREEGPVPPLVPQGPRQLPSALTSFVGREAEMAVLTGLLDRSGDPPGAVVISAIGGTAGVGKTALAVQWAHRVAARFPDGQLYMNLRGFDPSRSPMDPAEVIRAFLDALGVPAAAVPAQVEARAGLYRSLMAGKRMLIMLDNARDEGQVRPLLPASRASLVLVTSRNQLSGLAVSDGARLVSLDLLAHDEAVQLLSARIGDRQAAAEPEAVDEIATLCAHLPLALTVVAARAAAHPRFPLTELAAELRNAPGRLDALDAGDPAASVTAVFSWSYRKFGTAAARMFRLLGLHPGPDISVPAAASLAAVDEPQARRLLRELARDCLVSEHVPGRYTFHDLLRAYAADIARDCDSQPDRDAAIGRILDHYLHTAARAALLLRPGSESVTLAPPTTGTRPERPADHPQAVAWFEAEHRVLLSAVTLAAETGADSHAWQLPFAMNLYLFQRGYPQERLTIMSVALAATTRLGDEPGQARFLRYLGIVCGEVGAYDQARAHLERCLSLYQRLGDLLGEARTQQNLSVLAEAHGRFADALGHSEQSLLLYQAIGDEAGEALVLNGVGWCHALLGDYRRARAACERSLALMAKLGANHYEPAVRDTLGYIELHLGNFAQAFSHFEVALGMCREQGHRSQEAGVLLHIGEAHQAAHELPQARQAWQQALAIFSDIHHPGAEKVRAKLASTDC